MFAHPDDEVLGPGGTLAHYAKSGAQVELVCTTRGEAGEIADPKLATPETLAKVREQELFCSAKSLGIDRVTLLDYRDSGMAGTRDNYHPDAFINASPEHVLPQLVEVIRRLRPQIVITFEPYGGYGHPDHIAINRHTHSAILAAASPTYRPELGPAWTIARLFYDVLPMSHFVEMKRRMEVQGMDVSFFEQLDHRRQKGWPDEKIHCVMDVAATIDGKWNALKCHRTQFGPDNLFQRLPEADLKEIFSKEHFALAYPEPADSLRLSHLFHNMARSENEEVEA
jgi:LmbE family N-acetylglucosaminyl deacetylase